MDAHAIFWTGPKRVEYKAFELAEPGSGEVLVEMAYSLVSPGTEREWLSSDESHAVLGTTFPFIPGYSAAGRVAEVGADVDGWSVGDAVVASSLTGAHASHVVVSTDALFRVPDGVPLRNAVFFNLGMTAVHTVRLSEVRLGDSLTIVGQGPIGAFATQVARAQGAHPIVALELDDERRAASTRLGATHALDPRRTEELDAVLAELGGGTSASIDLSASVSGVDVALHTTAARGVVVLSTGMSAPMTIDYGTLFVKGLVLKGAFVGARPAEAHRDTEEFLRLLATGDVEAPDVEHELFEPRRAEEIYGRVLAADRSLTAPMFVWSGSS